MKRAWTTLLLLTALILFSSYIKTNQRYPITVFLTWEKKPESSMVIRWITPLNKIESEVLYRRADQTDWLAVQGEQRRFPEGNPYLIHSAELTELTPNTDYIFTVSKESPPFKFRTMPAELDAPIQFIAGGDMYPGKLATLQRTCQIAARRDPMFALVGGDIAYSADCFGWHTENVERWLRFLITWQKEMVTSDGRLIPMIPVIGNHDVKGRYGKSVEKAPFFYKVIATPEFQGYGALDFGSYMTLLRLDTNHTHPVDGEQTAWLKETIATRTTFAHKFALYHVPAYPATQDYTARLSASLRELWVPFFEEFGVAAAFENHEHCYKRTHPMRAGKIDSNGIVYIGGGAWGVRTCSPDEDEERWYLAKAAAVRHFILVTIDKESRRFEVISDTGELIDSLKQPLKSVLN